MFNHTRVLFLCRFIVSLGICLLLCRENFKRDVCLKGDDTDGMWSVEGTMPPLRVQTYSSIFHLEYSIGRGTLPICEKGSNGKGNPGLSMLDIDLELANTLNLCGIVMPLEHPDLACFNLCWMRASAHTFYRILAYLGEISPSRKVRAQRSRSSVLDGRQGVDDTMPEPNRMDNEMAMVGTWWRLLHASGVFFEPQLALAHATPLNNAPSEARICT